MCVRACVRVCVCVCVRVSVCVCVRERGRGRGRFLLCVSENTLTRLSTKTSPEHFPQLQNHAPCDNVSARIDLSRVLWNAIPRLERCEISRPTTLRPRYQLALESPWVRIGICSHGDLVLAVRLGHRQLQTVMCHELTLSDMTHDDVTSPPSPRAHTAHANTHTHTHSPLSQHVYRTHAHANAHPCQSHKTTHTHTHLHDKYSQY
jgi:hypothetical protein